MIKALKATGAILAIALCPALFATAPAQAAAAAVPVDATNHPIERHAPSPCESTMNQPGAIAADVPWPQQRYIPDRLTGLADGGGVLVAVIDSGVDADHPQLKGAVTRGYDGLDGAGDGRLDCVGHGTAVASIIAARPIAKSGFRGLAPAARILPIRISERQEVDGTAAGRTAGMAGLASGIRRAVARHAKVINVSLVSYGADDPAVREAVAYALANDVVVVAAAGNRHEQGDPTPYPAAYPGVIGVGAIGPDGRRLAESEVGTFVDLAAPGGQVTAATRGYGHAVWSGTSFAVPFVAATAALVRQYQPDLTAGEVAARLLATADPAPAGPGSGEYGAGVVNPYRAVAERQDAAAARWKPAPLPGRPDSSRAAARTRARAVGITSIGVAGIAAICLTAVVLSRGRRRRWQPSLR